MKYTHRSFSYVDDVDKFLNAFSLLGYNLSQYVLGITNSQSGANVVFNVFYKTNEEIDKQLSELNYF